MSNVFNEKFYEHLTEEDLANEQWADIEGYEGLYEISSCGRVRSLKFGKVRVLKPRTHTDGYLLVDLCKNGKIRTVTIHRIVAEAFIPNPEKKSQINHIFGNKKDNRVCALEWCNPYENIQHAIKTGLFDNTGENHGCSKLTDEDCKEIRTRYATGNFSQKFLGEEYGVSDAQISKIINYKSRSRPTPSLTH